MDASESLWRKKELLTSLLRMRKPELRPVRAVCGDCKAELSMEELRGRFFVCPRCGVYLPMSPMDRLRMLVDEGSFRETAKGLFSRDPLAFPEYAQKLEQNRRKSGGEEAVVTGVARMGGRPIAIGVLDSRFLMGSMGTVVGEKLARLTELAMKKHLPLITVSASGGARMQEGLFSLMQMAKTSAAVERFKRAGGLYVSVLCNPTTGGVSASFASLGDILIAEPKALLCFAGPRVIEQTIGEKLPEGFQRAEFLMEHGMIDAIVPRAEQREYLCRILRLHDRKKRGTEE